MLLRSVAYAATRALSAYGFDENTVSMVMSTPGAFSRKLSPSLRSLQDRKPIPAASIKIYSLSFLIFLESNVDTNIIDSVVRVCVSGSTLTSGILLRVDIDLCEL